MMGPIVLAAVVLMVVPGGALFLFYGRKKTSRRGVVGKVSRRDDLLVTGAPDISMLSLLRGGGFGTV